MEYGIFTFEPIPLSSFKAAPRAYVFGEFLSR